MTDATLENYDKLKDKGAQAMGIELPTLKSAALKLTPEQGNLVNVHEAIKQFAAKYSISSGWAMLADKVLLTCETPDSDALLQAQYTDGNNSLHIQHLGQNCYQITWFEVVENEDCRQYYREQDLVLRPNMGKSHSKVRFWFQEIDSRWQPVAQQFVGLMNLAQG